MRTIAKHVVRKPLVIANATDAQASGWNKQLRERFAARPAGPCWPRTDQTREDTIAWLTSAPFVSENKTTQVLAAAASPSWWTGCRHFQVTRGNSAGNSAASNAIRVRPGRSCRCDGFLRRSAVRPRVRTRGWCVGRRRERCPAQAAAGRNRPSSAPADMHSPLGVDQLHAVADGDIRDMRFGIRRVILAQQEARRLPATGWAIGKRREGRR